MFARIPMCKNCRYAGRLSHAQVGVPFARHARVVIFPPRQDTSVLCPRDSAPFS